MTVRRSLLLAGLLAPTAAVASGLNVPVVGTSESSPVHADPAAIFWNPALLTAVGTESLFTGSLLVLDLKYARQRRGRYQFDDSLRFEAPVPDEDIDPSKAGGAPEARATALLPAGAFFGSWRVHRDGVVGLGVFAPFGALLDFGVGPQEWAVRDVSLITLEVAPAIAWKIGPHFSVGGGVSAVGGFLKLGKTVDLAGTPLLADTFSNPPISQPNSFGARAPSEVRELDVLSRRADIGPAFALGFAARLGVSYEPDDAWRFGLSYTYRGPMTFHGDFELDLNDPLFTEDLAAQGLKYDPIVRGTATVDFPLPSNLNAGARWAHDHWVASATFSWFQYSAVESLDATLESNQLVQPELGLGRKTSVAIPRDWQDTVHFDGRLTYAEPERWRVGGVLGFHTGVSPDSTLDVASPDGPRLVMAALGAWSLGQVDWLSADVELVGDLHVQYVLPRENTQSDYDLANGEYSLLVLAGTAGARVRW